MTRVLVTNDDGIDSPGLHALAEMAARQGFEVVVAAPIGESSGTSAGITAQEEQGRVVMQKRELPGLADVRAYAVAASPAFIVLIATRGAFGDPPDLVLSGINHGANFGNAVIHSGTVGAALTGATYGCCAMAVSLDVGLDARESPHWTTASAVAEQLLSLALDAPSGVAVNLNVPDVDPARLRGVRHGTLAAFGAVQTNLELGDGYVRTTIADHSDKFDPGTDAAVLADGYASVTALAAVTEAYEAQIPASQGPLPADRQDRGSAKA